MIRACQRYFATIPPVFTDGLTYVLIAWSAAWSAVLAADDAAKFLSPQLLFWLRAGFSTGGAALLALKMFRSTTFADHQKKKEEAHDTNPPFKPL